MLKIKSPVILIIAVSLLLTLPCYSQTKEYLVKAGLMYKITRFIKWPPQQLASSNNFNLIILGKNPFEKSVEKFFNDLQVQSKPANVSYAYTLNEVTDCQILYISNSEKDNIDEIIKATKDKPILLVSDTKGFAQKGVHINFFFTPSGTISFELNPDSFDQSGLTLDGLILNIATIVK